MYGIQLGYSVSRDVEKQAESSVPQVAEGEFVDVENAYTADKFLLDISLCEDEVLEAMILKSIELLYLSINFI